MATSNPGIRIASRCRITAHPARTAPAAPTRIPILAAATVKTHTASINAKMRTAQLRLTGSRSASDRAAGSVLKGFISQGQAYTIFLCAVEQLDLGWSIAREPAVNDLLRRESMGQSPLIASLLFWHSSPQRLVRG